MHTKKICLSCLILFFLISSGLSITAQSQDSPIPNWNSGWKYRQEIKLPISTADASAKYQPIDLHIDFTNPCWAEDEKNHSVRICCWDGSKWNELESQIYDLAFKDSYHLYRCGIIFLVPEFANGNEQYFVYYDDKEKSSSNYVDHVSIEDAYYYYEPISGVKAEGDYYKITEDGYCVYGVGQKGKVFNRYMSQAVVKMKPKSKEFSVSNSENMGSFCFTYNNGAKDEDQVSSDQVLISKEIRIDGNLMTEFKIVSESKGNDLRTSNLYRYYYSPITNKRIVVHVKHEVFKEGTAEGQLNIDGLYGGLVTYQSRSGKIQSLRFGKILHYLHVYGENDQIREYCIPTNPESKEREWVVPYSDDCDLGKDAWISYDEGETGRAYGILFSSNKDIVKRGKNEKDGIQVKAADKEYLDVLGTEIDYAAVVFGRNSFEKGGTHDITIAGDLVAEFDAELFTSEENGYNDVISEAKYFQELVKYRESSEGPSGGNQNIYTLTVIPRLTGRFLSSLFSTNRAGFNILSISAELYKNGELITKGVLYKNLFGIPKIKFTKIAPGDYVVKVYRKIGNRDRKIIGIEPVCIDKDKFLDVFCTWEKNIKITARDQSGKRIENVELNLFKNDTVVLSNVTKNEVDIVLKLPFSFLKLYSLEAYYKGFMIYNSTIARTKKTIDLNLDLYDLTVDAKDELGFSPGVELITTLTSPEMNNPIDLIPENLKNGKYLFKDLPAAKYELSVSYGRFYDQMIVDLPEDGDSANIKFTAFFDLSSEILDSRGSPINDNNAYIIIEREGKTIFGSISPNENVALPPGKYTLNVYSDGTHIGTKIVELTNDKNVKIVTKIEPLLPTLITALAIIFIAEICVLIIFKKITLNTFLKLIALSLIFISIFQPWWTLNSHSENPIAEKNSEMFIVPQTMMETITYKQEAYPELATLPEMFTDFVSILLLVVISGIVLLCISFIPNILLKRRFSLVLIFASTLFLILVALAFSFGMSKITELSLGNLNGEGIVSVLLPNGESVCMLSEWGLGPGFYMFVVSAIILILAGIIDYLRRKQVKIKITKKRR